MTDSGEPSDDDAEGALGFVVLFPGADAIDLDEAAFVEALREYSDETRNAHCPLWTQSDSESSLLVQVRWSDHVVRILGFSAPMPEDALAACLDPAHFPDEWKEEVRRHEAHLILWYEGQDEDPLEQYAMLTAVAGVLAEFGALAIVNENAHAAIPAQVVAPNEDVEDDMMEALRTLPLPFLYVGLVKYEVEGTEGVWMRTHGADILALADLAYFAENHAEGSNVLELFSSVLRYQLETGVELAAGHTMQVGAEAFLRLRDPSEDEYYLDSEGDLFVAELIEPDEFNGG